MVSLLLLVSPAHAEKRVLNNRTYDLDTNPSGWWTVTGTVVQPALTGWIIEGNAVMGTNRFSGRFILKNPPQAEYNTWLANKQQYDRLAAQAGMAKSASASADRKSLDAQVRADSTVIAGKTATTMNRKLAQQEAAQNEAFRQNSIATTQNNRAAAIKRDMEDLERRTGRSLRGPFTLRGKAMLTGKTPQGQPIYDQGRKL